MTIDEASAARIEATLDAISSALLATDAKTLPWGLVEGAAGVAITHAYLGPRFPERDHQGAALALLGHAGAHASTTRDPWLADGASGIGWAFEHLAGDASDIDRAEATDRALLTTLQRQASPAREAPWELLFGVAGIVPYAISRLARPTGRALAVAAAQSLLAAAERSACGTLWRSAPDANPFVVHAASYENHGFAHGIPGVLGALALLMEHDVLADEIAATSLEGASTLLERRLHGERALFRTTSDDDGRPARSAWCYGDPGVAWSLLRVATVTGNHALRREALTVANVAAERPVAEAGVEGAGFCHGAAGLSHLFRLMSRLAPEAPALRAASSAWLARALIDPGDVARYRPGLLDGLSGIAMVLSSALADDDSDWDRCLVLR